MLDCCRYPDGGGTAILKQIPKVDKVLQWQQIAPFLGKYPRPVVIGAVRSVLDALRTMARQGSCDTAAFAEESIASLIAHELAAGDTPKLKKVINGTGVVIHTNLGRAPLAAEVGEALNAVAFGYSNLELDLATGERGSRYAHVEELICQLTGAEAALVVNNNAAAVLLALASLAAGREVVVSRGELVEIGGSFRIPDVMEQSGARLKEVGTTNRTHLQDYAGSITAETALLLKVHCSNFAVVGFTAAVSAQDLVEIGRQHALPVMADIGSGSFLDLRRLVGGDEPTVQEFVRAGVDVVTFSGDKLLGGPQAGIIVGSSALLSPMRKHPLLRAVRIDKLTLAALEATLRLYRDDRVALAKIPALRMVAAPASELCRRAKSILRRLRHNLPGKVELDLVEGFSQVGGGALPLLELPTTLISVGSGTTSPQEIERMLRNGTPPVLGRISKGAFLLDPRTIPDEDIPALLAALTGLAGILGR